MPRPERPVAPIVRPAGADLPRIRFYPPLADGSVIVRDRAFRCLMIVYQAKTGAEFAGGHMGQRWYVRAVADGKVNVPASRPFEAFEAAAQAIRDGSWVAVASHADTRPVRMRGR